MGAACDAFSKVCKKAVLTGVLGVSLLAGGQSAFAQQAGPPPQPSTGPVAVEQARIPAKPWSNDPNYIRLVNAYEHGEAAREKIYRANEHGGREISDAQLQIQEANLEQNRMNYMRSPQGQANYYAAQLQVTTAHQTQLMQYKATLDRQLSTEDIQHDQYINNLDTRFGNLPQYKAGAVAQPGQGLPPWVNDPAYRQQMDNLERQQELARRTDDANTSVQLRTLDANNAAAQMTVNANGGINAWRQGLPGIARLSAQDKIMTAQYGMNRTSIEASHEARIAAQEAQKAEFMFSLDVRFGSLPQYKNSVMPQTTQPVQRTTPGAKGPGA